MGCGGSKSKNAVDISKKRQVNVTSPVPEKLSTLLPQSGPLPTSNYWSRLSLSDSTQEVTLEKAQYSLKYAYTSLRGFYPDALTKRNQDDICAHQLFGHEAEQLLFAVFDGHGTEGHLCAQFAKNKLPDMVTSYPHFAADPEKAFKHMLPDIHAQLHSSNIDDSMSGTTCIATLIQGRKVYIANVGDSRAVIAENINGTVTARALSQDQTPFRPDEAARVRSLGAQVMTMAQLELGLEVMDYASEEEQGGDPPRIWAPGANFPGTAFTRSLGDSVGKGIGVSADPEVQIEKLDARSLFMVLASDGVFEFMNNQEVVDLVAKHEDVQSATVALVSAAYSRWLENEQRTDDITAIVIVFADLDATRPPSLEEPQPGSEQPPTLKEGALYRLGSKVGSRRRATSEEPDTSQHLMSTQEMINASHKNLNTAEAAQRPKIGPGGMYNRITAIPDIADNDRRNSTDASS